MTTDERIDKLTERHEALTQYLELTSREWDSRFAQIASSIESLARIAEMHEHRLEGLEN